MEILKLIANGLWTRNSMKRYSEGTKPVLKRNLINRLMNIIKPKRLLQLRVHNLAKFSRV